MLGEQTRRIMINGREMVVPGEVTTPEELKEAAGIDPFRNLIRQAAESNEILSDGQPLHLADGDHFSDAPTFKYG